MKNLKGLGEKDGVVFLRGGDGGGEGGLLLPQYTPTRFNVVQY